MKRLITAGLILAVMGLGAWAIYRDTSTAPARGRDLVELSAEPLARLVLRLEGLAGVEQVRTPSQTAMRVAPPGLVSPDGTGAAEEPL